MVGVPAFLQLDHQPVPGEGLLELGLHLLHVVSHVFCPIEPHCKDLIVPGAREFIVPPQLLEGFLDQQDGGQGSHLLANTLIPSWILFPSLPLLEVRWFENPL